MLDNELKNEYKTLVYKSAHILYEKRILYVTQNDCMGDYTMWDWNLIMNNRPYRDRLNEIGVQFVVGYRFIPTWDLDSDVESIKTEMDNFIGTCYEICIEKFELLNPDSIWITSNMEKEFVKPFNIDTHIRHEEENCKFENGVWKDFYNEKLMLQILQRTTEYYERTYTYRQYDKVQEETLFGQIAEQITEQNIHGGSGYYALNSFEEMSLPYETKNEKYTKDIMSLSKYGIMNDSISEKTAEKSDYESKEEEKFDAYMYDKIMNYIKSAPESTGDNKPKKSKRSFSYEEQKYWHDRAYY